jgi:hypothetical protein
LHFGLGPLRTEERELLEAANRQAIQRSPGPVGQALEGRGAHGRRPSVGPNSRTSRVQNSAHWRVRQQCRRHRRRPLPNPCGVLGFHMVRRQDAPPRARAGEAALNGPWPSAGSGPTPPDRPDHAVPSALRGRAQCGPLAGVARRLSPAAARADTRAVHAGARPPGARGRQGHLPDQPAPSPPVAAPDRPLDRVCELGGGGVTDAWFRAGSDS